MIFKELRKNVFHVKNVFPTEMFLRVSDEFNPINNHWTFDKESSYDDGNSSIRGKLVKSSSFMGDNLVLIDYTKSLPILHSFHQLIPTILILFYSKDFHHHICS